MNPYEKKNQDIPNTYINISSNIFTWQKMWCVVNWKERSETLSQKKNELKKLFTEHIFCGKGW